MKIKMIRGESSFTQGYDPVDEAMAKADYACRVSEYRSLGVDGELQLINDDGKIVRRILFQSPSGNTNTNSVKEFCII